MLDSEGRWRPETSPKQDEIREACRKYRYVLANGPRYSGKTVGCENAFIEHAWLTPKASECIITISQTVGMDSGIWKEFTEEIIPRWIAGDFGMRWVNRPYIAANTKKPTLEITNSVILTLDNAEDMGEDELREAGAVSTIQLESLKVEDEVEDRFKPRKYTGIYVPELTTFHNRKTFDTWCECLRVMGVPDEMTLFLADTNPPDDESWWIYDLWWTLLEANEADLDPIDFGFPENDPDAMDALVTLKRGLTRIDVRVEDNTFADVQHVKLLKARYAHNEELYKRYIIGEPVRTTEGSLFLKVFRPLFHCVGEEETLTNHFPEIMVPEPGCTTLYTGWDPGDSVNSAAVIADKFMLKTQIQTKEGVLEQEVPGFKFLDEKVITGEAHRIEDFVVQFMHRMEFWEDQIRQNGHKGKIRWVHYSDRSVFERLAAESQRYLVQVIYDASVLAIAQGIVNLSEPILVIAAERGPGTVLERVDLWSRMLFDDRLFFSQTYCPRLIAMNKGIKRGKAATAVIQKGTPHKHPFDAGSYLVASECHDEINRAVMRHLLASRKRPTSVVSVPL